MKNIHILPTDKPSRLQLTKNNKLFYSEFEKSYSDCSNKNIYITYDEKPKAGGWIENNGKIFNLDECKKIILTDNQYLIKDGVQAIDDEFLEWFVKNPSCESVEVRKIGKEWTYNAEVPKEEPNPFELPKTLSDDVFYESLEPKQETLEEVAERLYPISNPDNVTLVNSQTLLRNVLIRGAKYQAERMYSEEEVTQLLIKFNQEIYEVEDVRGWFNQNKKK